MIMKKVQTNLTVTIALSQIASIPNLLGKHDASDSQLAVGLL